MTFRHIVLCAIALLIPVSVAIAQEPIKDQVSCYTTWDENYFYLAFKVDSVDVRANQSKPNADISGDDCVEFYIETDNKHSMKISPACSAMAVSAAGGSCFRAGNDKGVLELTPAFTFKYGVTVQGTLNNSDDVDMGYNVEIAAPWALLGTKAPAIGAMMSFNVIVRRHGDKAGSFVSLSPRVKSEEDALVPAKWVNIVFAAHSFGVATTSVEKILSAKYVVRSPLIDGAINDREWHQNTSFAIDLPMPPGFVYEAKYPVQRMVLAKYLYWYQADPRRDVPVSHIPSSDGSTSLAELPAKGVGPWFSADRVQWHKEELAAIADAGIGVVLPDYLGAAAVSPGFADKGLDCMVSALGELRKEGKLYPMVGMLLDASRLPDEARDLGSEAGRREFYSLIERFFARIPTDFRAYAPAAKPNAGKPAAVVFVANAASFSALSSAALAYCSDAFAKDFGCPLVWASDAGPANDVCGAMNPSITIGCVTCTDDYDSQWESVLKSNPLWIYCDAWNDFTTGRCICPTQSLGARRADSTKAHIKRFLVARDYSARFLRFDVPKVIAPKQIAQAELTIRNAGNSTWRAADGYALGYRWYRSGRYFGDSKVRRPLAQDVAPGDTVTLEIGIATVTATNAPMPEGNYELRLELIRLSDNKWFSALGDLPLMVPVTIGQPGEFDATCLSCNAPNMVAPNHAYPISVRVRNDGTQTWRAGDVRLECKLFKVSRAIPSPSNDTARTEVPIAPIRIPLSKACKPGDIAEFEGVVAIASKKALDLTGLDDDWSYRLEFNLVEATKNARRVGPLCTCAISLFAADFGPRIVDCDIPAALPPGQSVQAKVLIRNTGVVTWDPKKTKIGCHWYARNGNELEWDGVCTPIKTKVEPGWPAVVTATVKTPLQEGSYVLVWDLNIDGKWLSTYPLTRGGDILPVAVEVKKQSGQ